MNCKPGDTAIIIGSSVYAGRIVETLYLAPQEKFSLPNGVLHASSGPERWAIRSLGTPFPGALGDGMFGCAPDSHLRPLVKLKETEALEVETI